MYCTSIVCTCTSIVIHPCSCTVCGQPEGYFVTCMSHYIVDLRDHVIHVYVHVHVRRSTCECDQIVCETWPFRKDLNTLANLKIKLIIKIRTAFQSDLCMKKDRFL